jgi:hypothetical protein
LRELREAIANIQPSRPEVDRSSIQESLSGQLSLLSPEATEGEEVTQSSPNKIEIWTTPEITDKLGISRDRLKRLKAQNKLPHTERGYTILRFSGKQSQSPWGNLWEVQEA